MIDFPWDRSTWITLRDGVRRTTYALDRLATHPEKRPQDETEDEMRARHRKYGRGQWPTPPGKDPEDGR